MGVVPTGGAHKSTGGWCEGSNPPQGGVPGAGITPARSIGSMTWWADSTMEHACATFACERNQTDTNFKYLSLPLIWFPKGELSFFLRISVVTHKDASNNTVKYLKFVSVWFRSHANVAQACSIVLSAPPGHTATPISQE